MRLGGAFLLAALVLPANTLDALLLLCGTYMSILTVNALWRCMGFFVFFCLFFFLNFGVTSIDLQYTSSPFLSLCFSQNPMQALGTWELHDQEEKLCGCW